MKSRNEKKVTKKVRMKSRSVWSGRAICEGAAARAKTARHDPSQKSLFLFCTITGIFASKENIYLLVVGCGVVVAAAVKVQKVQKSW